MKRSSRPKKSPYWESSPLNVVLPRLWYRVRSLSHSGTLRGSPAATTGVYGKLAAGSSAGKLLVPA